MIIVVSSLQALVVVLVDIVVNYIVVVLVYIEY